MTITKEEIKKIVGNTRWSCVCQRIFDAVNYRKSADFKLVSTSDFFYLERKDRNGKLLRDGIRVRHGSLSHRNNLYLVW